MWDGALGSACTRGAVRVAGDRLRVTVALVQVADGYVLWSDRFDRKISDIFGIQDEVCAAIVGSLREKLTTAADYKPSRRPTQNMAADDVYLKGTFHLDRLIASDLRRGAALLEEATRADPEFTLALVGLSVYYSTIAIRATRHPAKSCREPRISLVEHSRSIHNFPRLIAPLAWRGCSSGTGRAPRPHNIVR